MVVPLTPLSQRRTFGVALLDTQQNPFVKVIRPCFDAIKARSAGGIYATGCRGCPESCGDNRERRLGVFRHSSFSTNSRRSCSTTPVPSPWQQTFPHTGGPTRLGCA